MNTKTTNENLENNSNQFQIEQKQIINELKINKMGTLNNKEIIKINSLQVCEIQVFELEEIIENPTKEEIEIWNEMSEYEWAGDLCSKEIESLWLEKLRGLIDEEKLRNEIEV